mmetsp:Transcript_32565/g.31800  ORF Transcript_32565/g.31800 Transcript_32565/m.31800 type:complete len:105 (-) Transcript_32565:167-481(-)
MAIKRQEIFDLELLQELEEYNSDNELFVQMSQIEMKKIMKEYSQNKRRKLQVEKLTQDMKDEALLTKNEEEAKIMRKFMDDDAVNEEFKKLAGKRKSVNSDNSN